MTVKINFYTRDRCPLCDKAKADLLEIREELPFELEEIDIETSDELTEQFGLMIPVVYLNGEEAGYGIIDKLYMRNLIRESSRLK
ncbi:glutaredoxin family protein [Neobacillus notoginsengisoli]|uniref:Glutaredoxin family protein n=1 Tax=Neobacillus notoginsengisoli TaxID=1578198 RepID=A0A417YSE8_9BACI|nr:glutaredoxin family protein [Neobacillus notoginsengisoli]RHW38928.1 glutaredoxin family protein [Neobacillus notoginsengisoli]